MTVMSEISKEALRDNVDAEVLRLINRVIQAQLDKDDEDAFPAIYRLTGIKSEVLSAFIATVMTVKVEPVELYAHLIAVGAILASEFQRRLVSIDRAQHALPDETTCANEGASKGGQP